MDHAAVRKGCKHAELCLLGKNGELERVLPQKTPSALVCSQALETGPIFEP